MILPNDKQAQNTTSVEKENSVLKVWVTVFKTINIVDLFALSCTWNIMRMA